MASAGWTPGQLPISAQASLSTSPDRPGVAALGADPARRPPVTPTAQSLFSLLLKFRPLSLCNLSSSREPTPARSKPTSPPHSATPRRASSHHRRLRDRPDPLRQQHRGRPAVCSLASSPWRLKQFLGRRRTPYAGPLHNPGEGLLLLACPPPPCRPDSSSVWRHNDHRRIREVLRRPPLVARSGDLPRPRYRPHTQLEWPATRADQSNRRAGRRRPPEHRSSRREQVHRALRRLGDPLHWRPRCAPASSAALDADAQRIDVAKTIYYRRRAGTLGILEELAADIATLDARCVEFFRRLGRTRHQFDPPLSYRIENPVSWPGRLHLRRASGCRGLIGAYSGTPAGGFADLRNPYAASNTGYAFDEFSYSADLRAALEDRWRRYNIRNLGVFLWWLEAFPIAAATPVAGGGTTASPCFTFDPSGRDMPLFCSRTQRAAAGRRLLTSSLGRELGVALRVGASGCHPSDSLEPAPAQRNPSAPLWQCLLDWPYGRRSKCAGPRLNGFYPPGARPLQLSRWRARRRHHRELQLRAAARHWRRRLQRRHPHPTSVRFGRRHCDRQGGSRRPRTQPSASPPFQTARPTPRFRLTTRSPTPGPTQTLTVPGRHDRSLYSAESGQRPVLRWTEPAPGDMDHHRRRRCRDWNSNRSLCSKDSGLAVRDIVLTGTSRRGLSPHGHARSRHLRLRSALPQSFFETAIDNQAACPHHSMDRRLCQARARHRAPDHRVPFGTRNGGIRH